MECHHRGTHVPVRVALYREPSKGQLDPRKESYLDLQKGRETMELAQFVYRLNHDCFTKIHFSVDDFPWMSPLATVRKSVYRFTHICF